MTAITNIAQVLDAAPPTPECFPDRLQWSQVLLSAQKYTKARVLPFSKSGVFQPAYNYCQDCLPNHEQQMALAGKCNPHKFRISVLNKELA